jgi:hypothetical protein
VLVGARRFEELAASSGDELPPAEAVDRLPRTLTPEAEVDAR